MLYRQCCLEWVLFVQIINQNISFPGTKAFDKVTAILMETRLLGDIEKLSPDAQTSCLEAFHATLNHWHPKMIHYPWLGTNCRYQHFSVLQCHIVLPSHYCISKMLLISKIVITPRVKNSRMSTVNKMSFLDDVRCVVILQIVKRRN